MYSLRYRIEPAPDGAPGWLVMHGRRLVVHCLMKKEATRILASLTRRSATDVKSDWRLSEQRQGTEAPIGRYS
jgi:hypothetical protein